jgi:hypothetical protein
MPAAVTTQTGSRTATTHSGACASRGSAALTMKAGGR